MDKAVERKKHWTEEEEKILTETVFKFLRDGRTQKEAFEEAALSIGRTPGACSFRWTNKLKKKKEETNNVSSPLSLEDCIEFLQTLSTEENLTSENNKLKEEQMELKRTLQTVENAFHDLKVKYKELLKQMDESELNPALQTTT
jgi:RsfA family transcription factor